jgi:paraquat-inducible protein B
LRGGDHAPYPEIPTIRSDIQEALANLKNWLTDFGENVDPEELADRINGILRGLDELVNSRDLRESLAGIDAIINKEDTQELTATLQATLKEFSSAASDAGSLIRNADTKLDTVELKPVIERLVATLDEAERLVATLDEAEATLAAAKFQLRGESVQSYQLGTTLKEVEGAARAMRELLDYLERNPEALLQGKEQ